jgi:hypothetical protein
MIVINQQSPAVSKKSDISEQKLWFQFSLHNFLSLRDRATFHFPDDPVFVAPKNGYEFDPKRWSFEKKHMKPGTPFLQSYYVHSPIHTVLEKKNQRDIIKLFVNYQGNSSEILNIKQYVINNFTKNGTFPFWSGSSTTSKYVDIWIKEHTEIIESTTNYDMKQTWNTLFTDKYPGEIIDRSKPICSNWTQCDEVIPNQQNNYISSHIENPLPYLDSSMTQESSHESGDFVESSKNNWIDQLEQEI